MIFVSAVMADVTPNTSSVIAVFYLRQVYAMAFRLNRAALANQRGQILCGRIVSFSPALDIGVSRLLPHHSFVR